MNGNELANETSKFFNAKKQRNILIIVILLLITAFGIFANHYYIIKKNYAISEQNREALADSVRYEKNRADNEVAVKKVLVAEKERELAELNAKLAEEVEKNKGKIREIIRTVTVIKHDTIRVPTTLIVYRKGEYGLDWRYDTTYNASNSLSIAGISRFTVDTLGIITPLETMITNNSIKFDMMTGLREKGGNIEIFATSNHPLLKTIELDGAIINPKRHPVITKFTKKKRFGFGPYVGVGIGVNMWPQTNIGVGFQVGIGVHYDIFQF